LWFGRVAAYLGSSGWWSCRVLSSYWCGVLIFRGRKRLLGLIATAAILRANLGDMLQSSIQAFVGAGLFHPSGCSRRPSAAEESRAQTRDPVACEDGEILSPCRRRMSQRDAGPCRVADYSIKLRTNCDFSSGTQPQGDRILMGERALIPGLLNCPRQSASGGTLVPLSRPIPQFHGPLVRVQYRLAESKTRSA